MTPRDIFERMLTSLDGISPERIRGKVVQGEWKYDDREVQQFWLCFKRGREFQRMWG